MKLPKRVKIGGSVFKVIITDDWEGRNEYDGECCYHATLGNVIYIGKDLSREAQEITLIHEAMHAMNSTINHEFLDSFAEQMYAFLKDNRLLR